MAKEKAAEEPLALLTTEELLAACDDVQFKEISVPEWRGSIRIGSLTADDMIAWSESNDDPAQKRVAGINLLVKSLVDANGHRIGTEAFTAKFKRSSHTLINRLCQEVLAFNGMTARAQGAVKNGSGEAVPDASPTTLH